MRIVDGTVVFDRSDLYFVEKFGPLEAAEMVMDFYSCNSHPFLYDTHQLASFFGCRHRTVFQCVREHDKLYRKVEIPKRNGGVRKLSVPMPYLAMLQQRILHGFLGHFPVSSYATAYRKGVDLGENAAPHCGKRYLLKLDLEDFFGSITFPMVYQAAFGPSRFPKQIGTMLTALCCYKDCLPQGACTSPALSNLVMKWIDETLGAWCEKRGVSYTRYCDDLTFSADRPLYDVYNKAVSLLESRGFTVNESKTRFITRAGRQTVTGLVVNEKTGVAADYKRRLRQELHYAVTYGIADAAARVQFEGTPRNYAHRLLGQLNFVLRFDPQNQWFLRARQQLFGRMRDEGLCSTPW